MSESRIRFAPDTGFRAIVTARVNAHFAQTGRSRLAGRYIYAKAALFAGVMIASYTALLSNTAGAWGSLALAILCGLATLFLVMNLSHDAAHIAVTGRRRVDTAIHRLLFVLLGIDGRLWQMRHDGSHHVFPNVNGCDVDIDENPFLRLSPNHPCRSFQRWQHLYAPFVYTLTLAHSLLVNDFVYLRMHRLANMRDIRHSALDVVLLFVTKAVYLTLFLALPLALIHLPWWQILLGYAVVSAVQSLVFVFLLVGTHFSDLAAYPAPGADGRLAASWSEHVLATSVDWLPRSRIALFFSGGANAHAAHHLFPKVSHRHNVALTAILREAAREYGLRYNETTFLGCIAHHFRHLRDLARDEVSPDKTWRQMPAR